MVDTVNILGIAYKVKRVPCIDKGNYLLGRVNFARQLIEIDDDMSEEQEEIALLHEVVHAILYMLHFNDANDDEQLVQGLALGFYQYLHALPPPAPGAAPTTKKGAGHG